MVFMTLRNGMKLVLCDGYNEIFQVAKETLNYLLILALSFPVSALLHRVSGYILKKLPDGRA